MSLTHFTAWTGNRHRLLISSYWWRRGWRGILTVFHQDRHGDCIILNFEVVLTLLREYIKLLHHLVKHLSLLWEGQKFMLMTKELMRAHLWSYGHLLGFTEQEDFNWDKGIFLDIEGDQTVMLSLILTLKDTSHSVHITVQQFSTLMLLKEDSTWKLVWVCLEPRGGWHVS